MNATNKNITWKEKPLTIRSKELRIGDKAPNFRLVNANLEDVELSNFHGSKVIISVVPSLDTSTCSTQTKRFNNEALKLGRNSHIITVSLDLPFAQQRWCNTEDATQVIALSDFKYRTFGEDYGVYIEELGLLTRAIFVIDSNGVIQHVEYTRNISDEPDYDAALNSFSRIK